MALTKIKSSGIESNAIVTAVIANESITGDKIAANTITLEKLEPNVVTQIASAGGGGSGGDSHDQYPHILKHTDTRRQEWLIDWSSNYIRRGRM